MISIITTGTRNLLRKFSFIPPTGDNALATIKDVNYVINSINNMVNYRPHDVNITQAGTGDPIIAKLSNGAVECGNNCGSDCSLCDCPGTCQNEGAGVFALSAARTGVGLYTFTVSGTAVASTTTAAILFTPFRDVTHRVTVLQLTATTYKISTFASGVPADDILKNTVVAWRFY